MNVLVEEDVRTLRLAEQGLMKQVLQVKAARIGELEAEVRYLRRLLNELLAAPKAQPFPKPTSATPVVRSSAVPPRRWKA
ncbi:MAG: hypothetical protein JNK54_03805 [Elusimicrobia bacterium]|nr:hypothetical protein [Elusimicrobiota bacterium]